MAGFRFTELPIIFTVNQYTSPKKTTMKKLNFVVLSLFLVAGASQFTIAQKLPGIDPSPADISIFSFQAVKNLPTGDSGMICVRDAELEIEARKWSWLGISKDTYARTASQGTYKWYYDVEHTGFKFN